MLLRRRRFLATPALALPWTQGLAAAGHDEALRAVRAGGAVVAFRHALAPGTFDPPGFKLGDCSTQRNLSDDGRHQARRIGQWFVAQGLQPARVRSSPWCRCIDTATLAFGQAEPWTALGSPRGSAEQTNEQNLGELRRALQAAAAQPQELQVWVTHMFVLSALTQQNSSSGEGLVLRPGQGNTVQVLGRFKL
ncbi:MAG: histidine phosphatase family protein [Rubrivivax sp.]|nr:histidine phosphatase family protein [Rubrivivax sp.]MDP3222014.1 histidine phosphatase family protein [Rubrivivax sp.]